MALNFVQTQRISQKQIQRLNQVQIQSLKYLAMNSFDLRDAVYAEANKNPALEIVKDEIEEGENEGSRTSGLSDYTRTGTASKSGEEKSDAFQSILESKADTRESLSEHLLFQFNVMNLKENQRVLGTKLIHNLDKNGFHILAPVSFLDFETDSQEDLEKCISIIQNLDPVGCCCSNIEESLFVQAKAVKNPPELALFILDGHLNFLNPPVASKVLKHITDFAREENEKAFNPKDYSFVKELSEEDVEEAIDFIKNLDPHPARNFSSNENAYIVPDVYVTKIPFVKSGSTTDLVINGSGENAHSFLIKKASGIVPEIAVSKDYLDIARMKNLPEEQKKTVTESIQNARQIMEMIKYRQDTILEATCAIVEAQTEFFEKGPGYLEPLVQRQIAELLSVHETTISRLANEKYLQCEWGIFPMKYFFTTGVSQGSDKKSGETISKDRIVFEMKKLIDAQKPGEKKLSDQKLCDILNAMGIKVARRTIAKYRSQLNIASSYDRV